MLLYMKRNHTLLDQFERSLSSRSLYELFNAINDRPRQFIRLKMPGDGRGHEGYLITDYIKDKGIYQYIRITSAMNCIRSICSTEDLFVGHFNMYNHMFYKTESAIFHNGKYTNAFQQLNTWILRKKIMVPIGSLRVKKFKRIHKPKGD